MYGKEYNIQVSLTADRDGKLCYIPQMPDESWNYTGDVDPRVSDRNCERATDVLLSSYLEYVILRGRTPSIPIYLAGRWTSN